MNQHLWSLWLLRLFVCDLLMNVMTAVLTVLTGWTHLVSPRLLCKTALLPAGCLIRQSTERDVPVSKLDEKTESLKGKPVWVVACLSALVLRCRLSVWLGVASWSGCDCFVHNLKLAAWMRFLSAEINIRIVFHRIHAKLENTSTIKWNKNDKMHWNRNTFMPFDLCSPEETVGWRVSGETLDLNDMSISFLSAWYWLEIMTNDVLLATGAHSDCRIWLKHLRPSLHSSRAMMGSLFLLRKHPSWEASAVSQWASSISVASQQVLQSWTHTRPDVRRVDRQKQLQWKTAQAGQICGYRLNDR